MATALILAPAGCSLGADEEPQPATGAPREIGAVVHRLERAIAAGDFESICENLFTADARERAGAVGEPGIDVRAIDLDDDMATVRVRTRARDQTTAPAVLRLQRERGEWRIEGLRR
jgi:hypothetical protein